MSIKKKLLALAAATALTAAMSVPAMALENEFHGMYRAMGYYTNVFNGATNHLPLAKDSGYNNYFEQRARLQYIAKANDDLKLVTHFELDTRFGGIGDGYKGIATGNDSGNIDADQLTLETKNIYLDFNCPITKTNFKVGIQPWADAYQSIFLLADMTGIYATKKFDPATVSLGWFRYNDAGPVSASSTTLKPAGRNDVDLIVLDGKYAINKDVTVGLSYYGMENGNTAVPAVRHLHMFGLNSNMKFDQVAINPFIAIQAGASASDKSLSGILGGATAKVSKVGPGNINFAFAYLSGDEAKGDGKDFQIVGPNYSYFNAANMWILIRNAAAVNSSSSIMGTTGNDLTNGGRGLIFFGAGYEGTANKLFYNANVGYAMVAKARGNEESGIGTELNAQVGYKIYDNLSASLAFAYVVLGDGLKSDTATERFGGAASAADPWLANLQLSYSF
jgi:hypothetical protein